MSQEKQTTHLYNKAHCIEQTELVYSWVMPEFCILAHWAVEGWFVDIVDSMGVAVGTKLNRIYNTLGCDTWAKIARFDSYMSARFGNSRGSFTTDTFSKEILECCAAVYNLIESVQSNCGVKLPTGGNTGTNVRAAVNKIYSALRHKHTEDVGALLRKHYGGKIEYVNNALFVITVKEPVLRCELENLAHTGSQFSNRMNMMVLVHPNVTQTIGG